MTTAAPFAFTVPLEGGADNSETGVLTGASPIQIVDEATMNEALLGALPPDGLPGDVLTIPFPDCFTLSWVMAGTDTSAEFDLGIAWTIPALQAPPNPYGISSYQAIPIPGGVLEVTAPVFDPDAARQIAVTNPGAFLALTLAVLPKVASESFVIEDMVCAGRFAL